MIERFAMTITPEAADIDVLGHVSNLVYLRWVLDVAMAHSAARGWDHAAYRTLGGIFVVRRHELDYLGQVTLGQQLVASTWVDSWKLASCVRAQMHGIRYDCLIIHSIDDETSSPRNPRLVASSIASTFLRTIWLDDSYHMITSDNEREIVARETALFLRESEMASRTGDAGGKPVVSKALARRLRQLAAIGKAGA